jgi:hypothetical protein
MAMNINYKKHNTFINKNPYDFRINFPFIWREVEETDKNMHTFIQYALLSDALNEKKELLLPHKMWTNNRLTGFTMQEGEEVLYDWDYNAAWNLNNISYLNK